MGRVEGKTAIVTGAGAGIGFACARKLLDEGAFVLLVDQHEESLQSAAVCLAGFEDRFHLLCRDVALEATQKEIIEEAIQWQGHCSILINNAAAFVMEDVSATAAAWQVAFNTNVVACARLGHWLREHAASDGKKRAIVNICSISSTHAQPKFATYNATKGALLTLTKCMALDFAAHGIRVNAVSPGTIWTQSNAGHIKARFGVGREGADAHPELGGKHVLGRLGDPCEVANAVCFLASDEASFITGANLYVDGGYSIV